MGSYIQYISVMTPTTVLGDISISVETNLYSSTDLGTGTTSIVGLPETINIPQAAAYTSIVSGVSGLSENSFAKNIFMKLGSDTRLNGFNYLGFLAYSEEVYPASFQITMTDNCVCIWSQTLFDIKVDSNTTGAKVVISRNPVFPTVAEARDKAILGIKTPAGIVLSDDQIITMLKDSCAYLTNVLHNNIVLSTYAKEIRGNDSNSISLGIRPVLDFDTPRVRRIDVNDLYNLPQWGKFAFFINHNRGMLGFRPSEHLVEKREPFARQNSVYVSFIAGHNTIPEELKTAALDLGMYTLNSVGNLKSMKGGSAAFEFIDNKLILARIFYPIKNYKMRP